MQRAAREVVKEAALKAFVTANVQTGENNSSPQQTVEKSGDIRKRQLDDPELKCLFRGWGIAKGGGRISVGKIII